MTDSATQRGHSAAQEYRWREAFDRLTEADRGGTIAAADLEQLATVAILSGHPGAAIDVLTRAHASYLDCGETAAAARCAGWIGIHLMQQSEHARGAGWFARARRLVAEYGEPCAVEGFLLVTDGMAALESGDAAVAQRTFEQVTVVGESFGDADLVSLGLLGQGQAQIMSGDTGPGLSHFDEVMVAVTAGEVSPIIAGIIYCAVIESCHQAFDLRRAQEWTTALDRWCDSQPELVPFNGQCQMHRAELYCLHGAWSEALASAQSAAVAAQDRLQRNDRWAVCGANYQQGEVHRLRGEHGLADAAYSQASREGFEIQPGLALLRLAQGRHSTAKAMIRQSIYEADAATRPRLLPAAIEIELGEGDVAAARRWTDELVAVSVANRMPLVQALAWQAEGAVMLQERDLTGALARLRKAWRMWLDLDVPYEAARCRVLIGRACRELGDNDSALMELDAASSMLRGLGATQAAAEVNRLPTDPTTVTTTPLTPRELEVLRLVATGKTNRVIAAAIFVSERTVDHHVGSIFTKLDLTSRAAATAYAYDHALVRPSET